MMSKFTPGPWRYRKNSFNCQGTRWQSGSIIGNGMYIAAIEGDMLESNANANLIAAAPDMYEALKELVRCHSEGGYVMPDEDVLKRARAALFKVDGGVDDAEGKRNE